MNNREHTVEGEMAKMQHTWESLQRIALEEQAKVENFFSPQNAYWVVNKYILVSL